MTTKTNNAKQKALADKQERKRRYNDLCASLHIFFYILIGVCVVTLALYFTQFVFVDNSDIGREVGVSGWSFFLACLGGKFSSEAAIFGDIAVPFYYYAKTFTVLSSIFTVLSVIAILALVVLLIVILTKKQYWLSIFCLIASIIAFLSLVITLILCFSMSAADILTIYCDNNPACSIGSDAIYPLIVSLAGLVLAIIVQIRYTKAEHILHPTKKSAQGAK